MSFTVSIIGRPNVGKSTLFNRLTGRKHAIVDDMPGVTRDRREGQGNIGPLEFLVIDTAGLEQADEDALETRMMRQTEQAVAQSDLVLMVIDGRVGVTKEDLFFASWIRKKNKDIVLVVNKCEGRGASFGIQESYKLGFGEPVAISAEHGEGLVDLYEAVAPHYERYEHGVGKIDISDDAIRDKHIQIAIVGRPNAGKSTLLNTLLQTERVLTGPEAGITRDAIAIDWHYKDNNIRLIDTAGIRRKSNIDNKLEKLSLEDALRAVRYAHVVILLIDANCPLEKQDLAIADIIIKEGRGIVLAINKWDSIEDKNAAFNEIKHQIDRLLPQIRNVPTIYLSALHGNNVEKAIDAALDVYKTWNKHISTAKLNTWLNQALERHPLPLGPHGKRLRIKYITQTKSRPPTFQLFASIPKEIPESYIRYLTNSIREEFEIPGVPIRMVLRKSDNPYAKKK
jgi:GTP-binding protein